MAPYFFYFAIGVSTLADKDGRLDLKRFGLSLATNQKGVPIYTEILSGNAPDKETIIQSIESIKKYLEDIAQEDLYYVADSSFYSHSLPYQRVV